MSRPRVVFLGRRAPALRAAARLGVDVIEVAAGERASGSPAGVCARLPWPADPDAWASLATRLPEVDRIVAVIGLIESAVVPAARLRARLGLPGLDVATAERCTDKLQMKQAVRAAGIGCADFAACDPGTSPDALIEAVGLPLVLKPRTASGTRGQRVIRAAHELPAPLPARHLAEAFVSGTELSCEALLANGRPLFESVTEYLVVGEANVVPAPLSRQTRAAVEGLHDAARRALGVHHGMTHLELFLGVQGAVFGELAARPPGGHIMRLLTLAWGFDAWEAWLRVHLGQQPRLPEAPRCAAGAWVLHPGPGHVRAVRGLDAVATLPGVVRARVRVRAGDRVEPRRGTGEEVGHLIVQGRAYDEAVARLRAARAALSIEMEPSDEGAAHRPSAR